MVVYVLYGGELAQDIAERITKEGRDKYSIEMVAADMSSFKAPKAGDEVPHSINILVLQTIENDAAPEAAGKFVRFFKRKAHPKDLLVGKMSYTVLALGDSNLLLDRQTTTAKDCNKAGQQLDERLAEIGGHRFYARGEADERTGLQEVEPWIASLWTPLLELKDKPPSSAIPPPPLSTYTIVYHKKIGFRAAPIQMLLTDAGESFSMAEPEWGDDFRVVSDNPGYAVFAPPVLRKGDFTLSQTCAIMSYLGQSHGYAPPAAPLEAAMTALQVCLDVGDITSELFGCAKDDAAKAKFASEGRLKNWLSHLDRIIKKSGGPWLLGETITYADFMLLSGMESLDFSIGADKVKEVTPESLQAWRAAMHERPFFAAYQAQATQILFDSMRVAGS